MRQLPAPGEEWGWRSYPPPQAAGRVWAPGRAAGVGGRGGGLHDEFSSELRELGSWALLGELGVCGGKRWYPGSDRGPPGKGTPREEHQESGEKPSSGSGAGEEVKQPRGVREGTRRGESPGEESRASKSAFLTGQRGGETPTGRGRRGLLAWSPVQPGGCVWHN